MQVLNDGRWANAHVSAPKRGVFPRYVHPKLAPRRGPSERASTPLTGLDANPHCPKNPAIPYTLPEVEHGALRRPAAGAGRRDTQVEEERFEMRSGPPRPDYGCEKENKWQRVL